MTNYHTTVKVHAEQSYAALRREVAQQDIPREIPPLVRILMNLLQKENIKTNGNCFFRYLSCSIGGKVIVEVGFPIEKTESKPAHIQFGSLPAGKYLTVLREGDYKNLIDAHLYLENYSESNNLILDESTTDTGVVWGCRTETYLTEPSITPIVDWKTEVSFLLK